MVLRKGFFQAIAFDCAPSLSAESLILPKRGINQIGQLTGNNDSVGMAAKCATNSAEGARLISRELEVNRLEMVAHAAFVIVAALENFAHPGGMLGFAGPGILHPPSAFETCN